jgi:Dullard-like phosphatase family protein
LLQRYIKPIINDIFSKLESLTQNELQKIYKEKIYVNMNINGSIIGSSTYFQKNKNYLNYSNDTKNVFFLNNKPSRRYTLVLDLDETLIHFKGNPNDDSSGLLQFRPYLSEFLFEVSKFYELIVFTAAVKDYADPIIDAIEAKGIKFDYRLYRVHTIVINNDFVKDLSRLGRDISRTIIVDNMEQNYKLQPENGITIRPFWGKDANDMALVDLLNVLVEIAKNNMDVRDGIRIFKEDIISRVTSNIFRRVQI